MITVHEQLIKYCAERGLPAPSHNDLENTGRMVAYQFKAHWCKKQPPGIVHNAGFLKQTEGDKQFVVFFYPHDYAPAMAKTFDVFYANKDKPRPERTETNTIKEPRKRISKPAFSGKKLIING